MVVSCTKMIFFFAGYGNIVPKTVQGRLFCVLYALIGIPGTCFTRKSIGDKITELFTKLIPNRLLWEMRFEKIPSDSKSGAKSCGDNDCGNCGLSTTINVSLARFMWKTRNSHISSVFNLLSRLWVQLVLVITFHNLRTTLITHLFFERLLEQYKRLVLRALCRHCARRTQRSVQKKNQVITMNNYPVTGTK